MTERLEGTALYLRRYYKRRHGTPKQLAKRFADNGASWVAIGGPWHEKRGRGVATLLMNPVSTCQRLADAFYAADVEPFIWGYPWQGTEEQFADQMNECAGEYNLALLDPELGSNPTRARREPGKFKANAHAELLVELMAERFEGGWCGLSTFGSGVRLKWFPLMAFAQTLAKHFPGRTFIGGQTYTDDRVIDRSIEDYVKTIEKVGGHDVMQLVPNFGTYTWTLNGSRGPRRKGAKAVAKTPEELYSHFGEFIDEGEPVHAMIGWAENFMNRQLWQMFARISDQLARGACAL